MQRMSLTEQDAADFIQTKLYVLLAASIIPSLPDTEKEEEKECLFTHASNYIKGYVAEALFSSSSTSLCLSTQPATCTNSV